MCGSPSSTDPARRPSPRTAEAGIRRDPRKAQIQKAGSIRVLLFAEHALVAEAVQVALSGHGILARTLPRDIVRRDLADLKRVVDSIRPAAGLIMCNIDDPPLLRDVFGLVRAIPLRWLLVTSSIDEARWGAVVEAGVRNVMPTAAGVDEVARILRLVALGRNGLSDATRERVLNAWHLAGEQHRMVVQRLADLTPRELTVLGLLDTGLSVKEIAERLHVAEGTVRSQVKSVLRKLGVNSQLAAVAAYQNQGRTPPAPAPRGQGRVRPRSVE